MNNHEAFDAKEREMEPNWETAYAGSYAAGVAMYHAGVPFVRLVTTAQRCGWQAAQDEQFRRTVVVGRPLVYEADGDVLFAAD